MSGVEADVLRWINVGLSGAVVSLLIIGALHRWDTMPRRYKRVTPWIIGTYAIIAYGSGEIAAGDLEVPLGLRVGMLMIDLAGLLIALLFGIGDDDKP